MVDDVVGAVAGDEHADFEVVFFWDCGHCFSFCVFPYEYSE